MMAPWKTAGITERAQHLYAKGESASQIAAILRQEFGVSVSRQAVLNKAVRAKWQSVYGTAGQVHKSPAFVAKKAVITAATCRAINANQDIQRRRIEASKSTKRDQLLSRGLLPDELDLYRSIRSKHLKAAQAAELIIASRRAAA